MMVLYSQKTVATALLSLVTIFLYADQNLLAPNLSLIAKDFNFSDEEKDWKLGGELAFGFFLLGAPVAILVGYLADSWNRCILFFVVVTLGECCCLLTYWTTNFNMLFLLRSMTGISIGGANPIIFSILGDFYPGTSRIIVATVISLSMSLGIGSGQIFSGLIGPVYGWRMPFLLIPIPAITGALLFLSIVKEPPRGGQEAYILNLVKTNINATDLISIEEKDGRNLPEFIRTVGHQYQNNEEVIQNPLHQHILINSSSAIITQQDQISISEKIDFNKLKILLSTPTVLLSYLQGIPGCIPWGIIYVFLNDYLSYNRGFSVQTATFVLVAFGVGGVLGQILGGYLGQYLYNRNKIYQSCLMGTSTILSAFPLLYIINGPHYSEKVMASYMAVSFIGGLVVAINGPNIRSVLQVRKRKNDNPIDFEAIHSNTLTSQAPVLNTEMCILHLLR